jgi:tripartite-type tricarboxylate transporter receptor subunit TctC
MAVIDALNTQLRNALRAPDMQEKLHFQGYEVTPSSPEQLASRINTDMDLWAPIIKKAGIKAE